VVKCHASYVNIWLCSKEVEAFISRLSGEEVQKPRFDPLACAGFVQGFGQDRYSLM
jgi:hypothetical protein